MGFHIPGGVLGVGRDRVRRRIQYDLPFREIRRRRRRHPAVHDHRLDDAVVEATPWTRHLPSAVRAICVTTVAGGWSSTGSSSFGNSTSRTSAAPQLVAGQERHVLVIQAVLLQLMGLGADDLRVAAWAEIIVDVDRHALGGRRRGPRAAAEIDDARYLVPVQSTP